MLADLWNSAEISLLGWEDLRPEPVFLKSKDISQRRVEEASLLLQEVYPGGGNQAVLETLLKS